MKFFFLRGGGRGMVKMIKFKEFDKMRVVLIVYIYRGFYCRSVIKSIKVKVG